MNQPMVTGIGLVVIAGILAQWMGWLFKVPALILPILAGLLLGPVTRFVEADLFFGQVLQPVVSFSIAIILFEGGLSLKLSDIREVRWELSRLITIGA